MVENTIEEILKARGFEPVGKSGIWEKKITEPRAGEIRANPRVGKANFHDIERDDIFETYSDVPELAEIQRLLEGQDADIRPVNQGQKMKEAPPAKNSVPAAIPAKSNMPAVNKGFTVGSIDGLPDQFIMKMGPKGQEKPYILKAGLLYLAKKLGLKSIVVEHVLWSWEKSEDGKKRAVCKATVEMSDGSTYTDIGVADTENVTNQVMWKNLDHFASTRASNRALRLATACGYCSIEELPEPPRHVIDAEFTDA